MNDTSEVEAAVRAVCRRKIERCIFPYAATLTDVEAELPEVSTFELRRQLNILAVSGRYKIHRTINGASISPIEL